MGRRVAGLLLALGAALLAAPAGAAQESPAPRVTAGERSVEAFVVQWCRPPGSGEARCAIATPAVGTRFPTLAAEQGGDVVIDTRAEATKVDVEVTADGAQRPSAVPVRRIDDRRWAFTMPASNARVTFDVAYANGGSAEALVFLRRLVGQTAGPTSLDAHRDVVAWSVRVDPPGAAPPVYHLVALVDGRARRLPVAPRPVPFDVDLGPREDGRMVAVYSRCAQEPPPAEMLGASTPYPPYTHGRGCDLYRFDFATARERKVEGASSDEASETLPSIWRGRIAFARVYERRSGLRGVAPHLYTRSLAGGPSRREPGGARGRSGLPGPISLDLYGRRLSFVWNHAREAGGVTELRLDTVGGGHRVLSSSRYDVDTYATFLSPQGVEGRILYAYQRVGIQEEGVAIPRPDGGHADAVKITGRSLSSLLLGYRIATADKDAVRTAGQLAGVASAGGKLFVARRSDLMAGEGGTTMIVDSGQRPPGG